MGNFFPGYESSHEIMFKKKEKYNTCVCMHKHVLNSSKLDHTSTHILKHSRWQCNSNANINSANLEI